MRRPLLLVGVGVVLVALVIASLLALGLAKTSGPGLPTYLSPPPAGPDCYVYVPSSGWQVAACTATCTQYLGFANQTGSISTPIPLFFVGFNKSTTCSYYAEVRALTLESVSMSGNDSVVLVFTTNRGPPPITATVISDQLSGSDVFRNWTTNSTVSVDIRLSGEGTLSAASSVTVIVAPFTG